MLWVPAYGCMRAAPYTLPGGRRQHLLMDSSKSPLTIYHVLSNSGSHTQTTNQLTNQMSKHHPNFLSSLLNPPPPARCQPGA